MTLFVLAKTADPSAPTLAELKAGKHLVGVSGLGMGSGGWFGSAIKAASDREISFSREATITAVLTSVDHRALGRLFRDLGRRKRIEARRRRVATQMRRTARRGARRSA